jgi:hypothetical protein
MITTFSAFHAVGLSGFQRSKTPDSVENLGNRKMSADIPFWRRVFFTQPPAPKSGVSGLPVLTVIIGGFQDAEKTP